MTLKGKIVGSRVESRQQVTKVQMDDSTQPRGDTQQKKEAAPIVATVVKGKEKRKSLLQKGRDAKGNAEKKYEEAQAKHDKAKELHGQAKGIAAIGESIASGETSAGELAGNTAMDMAEGKAEGLAARVEEDGQVVQAKQGLPCKRPVYS
mgnify:CR=1 FL=1